MCTEVLKLALGATNLLETADSVHGFLKTGVGTKRAGGVLPQLPMQMEGIIG